jgi:hypothetical protein
MHVVEIRRDGENLSGAMAAMRTWFDVRQIEPRLFQYSIISSQLVFRLEFEHGSEATAFARAFHGEIVADRGSIAA